LTPERDQTGDDVQGASALTRLFELAARSLHSAGHTGGLYPAQWTALRYLANARPADRTSAALARFQQMASGPVTRTVRTLIAKELVVKAGQAVHHRSEQLDVTQKGRNLLASDPLLQVDKVLAALPEAQAKTLAAILARIAASLQDIRGEADAEGLDIGG
jgi:DNA-binding MarR family transcriptional regulator